MSGKGNCWDNAAMESFFSTYKLENDLDDNSKTLLTPWELHVKPPIGLRVITIENAVIQVLTISAPLNTKNGLVETV
jgi:transposase InsO family protein